MPPYANDRVSGRYLRSMDIEALPEATLVLERRIAH
jgi:hypothetical protein